MDGDSQSLQWFPIRVKSRHEVVVEQQLYKKNIEVFSPMYTKKRQWKDRKKNVRFPLFPGYVFVHIPSKKTDLFYAVLKTIGVVDFLRFDTSDPSPVPDKEINDIMQMVQSGQHLDVFPYLKEGMRVRVKRGQLKGVEGILEKKITGQHMIIVTIELLNRSIAVSIDAGDVEPL
jgi:transcriptional antiterminator NusG